MATGRTHGDPITELPPPSRFDPDDLELQEDGDEQVLPSSIPPFMAWSKDCKAREGVLRPQMLLLCFSKPSCTVLHHVPGKKLIASIVLPEISMAGNKAVPSLDDRTCCIYALDGNHSILAALVQYKVPAERSHSWVKTLFKFIQPETTLALELLQPQHFRSKLTVDEPMLFLLETDKLREEEQQHQSGPRRHGIPYLPSGSLVDGVAAAALTYCQIRGLRGGMLVSWPEQEVHLLGEALQVLLDHCPAARTLGFAQASKASLGKRAVSSYELFM